jgi:hypothetical protein
LRVGKCPEFQVKEKAVQTPFQDYLSRAE